MSIDKDQMSSIDNTLMRRFFCRDKFTISEDGYGRIVGRLKDIIIRGGENIAPKEIEDLLNTHPDIVESQVSANKCSKLLTRNCLMCGQLE